MPPCIIVILFVFESHVVYCVGWLVVCGLNDPLRQYFSLYRVVSKEREKEKRKDR